MKNLHRRTHPRLLPALAAALALAASLSGQTTARPASTAPSKDEAIVLSPFTVNTDKDNGYIAADSLLAGRLSTELIKTPSDITVLTRDFINDIAATAGYGDPEPTQESK